MNIIKKCILLGILMLNLIPYMQDGKVKWTMTEAGAQSYILELILPIKAPINESVSQYCHYVGSYLMPNKNWCFYYSMAALGHGDACDNAHWYLEKCRPTYLNTGCDDVGGVADEGVLYEHKDIMFSHCLLSLGIRVDNATALIAAWLNKPIPLLCISDSHTHIYFYYGIDGNVTTPLVARYILKFDTTNGQNNFYLAERLGDIYFPKDNWIVP